MSTARRSVLLVLVGTLIAGACTSDNVGSSTTPSPTTSSRPGPDGEGPGSPSGAAGRLLGLRLSEGTAITDIATAVAFVDGVPLSPARIAEIEAALPEWQDSAQAEEFRWPVETLPPPVVGATVDVAFPPLVDSAPPDVPSGPLEVVRHQPDGEVPIAPFVTITFNQPMVPIGTLGQLDALEVPATITPAIPGHWQWIGTRTLRFDHDSDVIDRLPMATEYTVTVPAGTRAASGATLADDVRWTFTTPPVTAQSLTPSDTQWLPLEPIFLAVFDQRIDPAAVLETVTLEANGDRRAVRLATDAEVAADDTARAAASAAPEGRWFAFRPVDALPGDASINVEIGSGTPSAEGPRTSASAQRFSMRTYAPLRVVRASCGSPCRPGYGITVELNNELDPARFDPASIGIEPALPGARIGVYGNTISIEGGTAGRTNYTVTLPRALTDVFGQQLGDEERVSVEVGEALESLGQFASPMTTLDPLAGTTSLSITTVNHDEVRVRVYSVTPADWARYLEIVSRYEPEQRVDDFPWPLVSDRTVEVDAQDDRVAETSIDLTAELGGAPGHVVVVVDTNESYAEGSEEFWANRPAVTWAQSTAIGLDAMYAYGDDLVVWTTDLRTGAPLPGVAVESLSGAFSTVTDGNGVGRAGLPTSGVSVLAARSGDDVALLPVSYYQGDPGWTSVSVGAEPRFYVFSDRGVYRPGETVSIKGWVRLANDGRLTVIEPATELAWTAFDGQGNEIASGTTDVNVLGGFDLSFAIRPDTNLGWGYVELRVVDDTREPVIFGHSLRIEEFRRPEFEAVTHNESPGPYVSARPATVAVEARYYSGGGLAAAPVDWQVTTSSASYAPPGWDEYTFGEWQPWWFEGNYFAADVVGDTGPCCWPYQAPEVEEYHGTTNSAGDHYLRIDFEQRDGALPDLPVTVTAQATVTDVNRQAWSSTTNLLVHPAQFYVGLRSERTFVRQGDPLVVEAIVTDIDGAAIAGRSVTVTATRNEWQFVNGDWAEVPVDAQTCDVTSSVEAVPCTFATAVGGSYTVSSTIADDAGGRSRTEMTRWVSGADARPTRVVEQERLTLVPDRANYRPGDAAQVLVQSPFPTGEGLAVVTRNGQDTTQRFTLIDGSAVIEIPITERDIPNLDVWIEVVGTGARAGDDGKPLEGAPPRPAFAVNSLSLSVPPRSRTLDVSAVPRDPVTQPGAGTAIDITVEDSRGAPVAGAELAIVVVDEAVLALTDYELADPVAAFYLYGQNYLDSRLGRSTVVLATPDELARQGGDGAGSPEGTAAAASTAAGAALVPEMATDDATADRDEASEELNSAGGNSAAPVIDERTNFDALAVFAPSVTTDAAGRAVVDVELPDNLTRYRVMVVAVSGADRFGKGEATITARRPLMVRPSPPRFANFGDQFQLPVVVQNQTDAPLTVDVVLQTSNLTPTDVSGKQVTVPANDRVEVRFAVSASAAGTARFRVAAVSGSLGDAATLEIPVYTPSTAEAFATYGVIDEGAISQPVLAPEQVIAQFGGLEITTSSTSLQALTDAVIYLSSYDYDSVDAMASEIMAVTSLHDVLDAFDAEGMPSEAALDAAVREDVAGLVARQNDDGGWPYWERYRPSEVFISIQAAHALLLAREAGYSVPDDTLGRALGFLADVENRFDPSWSQATKDSLSAYALHVRALSGDRDTGKARTLYDTRRDDLPVDAMAWLWPILADPSRDAEIERFFMNRAVETAGAATFTTEYGDDAYVLLHSDRRSDGIVLDALITQRPQSDLIPKVVAGLLGGRTKGRWDNVQENSFILIALKHYFDVFESATPDFVARVWLGEHFAGEHAFTGRSTDSALIAIPTQALIDTGDADLVLANDGTGRLYYRLGLRYAPADLQLDPLDRGFEVQRVYEAVDDPADVTRDPDGTWHIAPGARVRVRLTLVAESQRTHVALIDPLPAGLEILNPELAVSPEMPIDPDVAEGDERGVTYPWYGTWYDHENIRDDRAEAFATYLGAGVYEYTYIARATTPGVFTAPPARAEEMYHPETFGRAGTDTVVIDAV